jgi:hypothetical protein
LDSQRSGNLSAPAAGQPGLQRRLSVADFAAAAHSDSRRSSFDGLDAAGIPPSDPYGRPGYNSRSNSIDLTEHLVRSTGAAHQYGASAPHSRRQSAGHINPVSTRTSSPIATAALPAPHDDVPAVDFKFEAQANHMVSSIVDTPSPARKRQHEGKISPDTFTMHRVNKLLDTLADPQDGQATLSPFKLPNPEQTQTKYAFYTFNFQDQLSVPSLLSISGNFFMF